MFGDNLKFIKTGDNSKFGMFGDNSKFDIFGDNSKFAIFGDNLAERSKAPASGAGPKGRGFKSHSCHI